MTGEAMVVLWGALKSCLQPGDKVLAVATASLAMGSGIWRGRWEQVQAMGFSTMRLPTCQVEEAIRSRPKMVTMVLRNTTGTLNPVGEVGKLVMSMKYLFYVDAVSSAAGSEPRG